MGTPNFANRTLYHGDNLPFLRGMNSETAQLIATDPPFNKNKEFHATPDSLASGAKFEDRWRWEEDVREEWVDAIQDDWPAVWQVIEAAKLAAGKDMAAFLCWLGVRVLEMHRILREDGSLYLHIDHTAVAYTKALLDAIFGRKQFRNEIVWCYTGPGNVRRWFPRKHDTLLFYAKSPAAIFNRDAVRIPYKQLNAQHREAGGGGIGGNLTPESVGEFQEKGKIPEDYWLEDRDGMSPVGRRAAERTGYPTQKPLALYERIIKASSNAGEWVLDPFCGCATTPVAAENLGRRWVGIDIWDKAHETVLKRLESVGLGDRPIKVADVGYSTVPPVRSDDNAVAAPPLKLKVQVAEPPGPKLSRQEMKDFLITQNGIVCAGCDREFDDPLYLELDHNTPRSDGGLNHISNRLLLCGPCNRIKSNTLTLSGLRRENKRRGRMADRSSR